jgi:hypothetical protein
MAVARQLLNPSILASFLTSSLHLARGLPAFLSEIITVPRILCGGDYLELKRGSNNLTRSTGKN